MAFNDCYPIIGGALMGDMITSVVHFPQKANINTSEHRTVDETQWLVNSQWISFENEYNKMIDVLGILRNIGFDQTRTLAVLPIYAGVGIARTQTGTFSLTATRRNDAPDYYELHGVVKDMNGTEKGGYWGIATIVFEYGGAWAVDTSYRAQLALCEWTNGLGAKYVGLYVQLQEKCNQPYNGEYGTYYDAGGACIRLDTLYNQFGIYGDSIGDPVPFSPEFGGGSVPDGGYNDDPDNPHGTFDFHSDTVPVPNLPSVGVTSAGFINVYKISTGALANLGEKLFPHFLPAEILADPSQLSTPEVLTMFIKTLFGTLISPIGTTVELADNLGIIDILMNGKLIDYILDCHIIPVDITAGTNEGLKVGYRQFEDLQVPRASSDYVEIDCGSISTGEAFRNFLDFSACTMKLFLPFVGFVPIQPEYWNGGNIGVKYHFNIVDGSFQVYVISTSGKSKLKNTVIAQYGGVCCVHLPITGLQYSNVVAGLVNGTAGAVASVMGGNPAGVATNAMNTAMLRPDAPSSNGYNASSSFLSERVPYLLIEYPTPQFSTQYNKEIGLPLNVSRTLSTVHGFTVIDNPILKIACSDIEYNELVSLLKNGVILP